MAERPQGQRDTEAGPPPQAAPWEGVPPGQDTGPSRWRARLPVAALALAGCAVSTYLALFQYGVLDSVWDPIFGDGSRQVLTSPLSEALPVRDAALGAVAYFAEFVLEISGGRRRWHDRPWLVALLGLAAVGLGLVGLVLVVSQPLLTGTFCTLCVCSALISFVVLALVRHEVLATVALVRRRRAAGRSFASALKGA
jgi:uncharacterized membrane protein